MMKIVIWRNLINLVAAKKYNYSKWNLFSVNMKILFENLDEKSF